jgi:hypothetical protein
MKAADFRSFTLWQFAIARTLWGDLFNRPDLGFVRSGNKRE